MLKAFENFKFIAAPDLHSTQKLQAYMTFRSRLPFHLWNRVVGVSLLRSPHRQKIGDYEPEFGFDNIIKKNIKGIIDIEKQSSFNIKSIYSSLFMIIIRKVLRWPYDWSLMISQPLGISNSRFQAVEGNNTLKSLEWLSAKNSVDFHCRLTRWA